VLFRSVDLSSATGTMASGGMKHTKATPTCCLPSHRSLTKIPSLLTILCVLMGLATISCEPIDAINQAIGQWKVKLSCSTCFGDSNTLIFPPRKLYDEKDPANTKRSSSMDCQLSLYPNGTFCLSPSDTNRFYLKGEWKVQRNPYCPTDRYYDKVVLDSYRRTQKNERGEIMQVGQFHLHAQLWGRYESFTGIRRLFGQRPIPRMNHGTMLWIIDEVTKNPWKSRRVCATFSAQRCQSKLEG